MMFNPEGVLQLGVLYAIPAVAVAFSFRIIGFPDLTVDGTFTLGASVGGILIIQGNETWLGLTLAVLCGGAAGMLTALLHGKLGISKLLSGILMMTMLYSLSLRVMDSSNLSLLSVDTFYSGLPYNTGGLGVLYAALPLLFVFTGLSFLMQTHAGVLLRATGDNDQALINRGISLLPQYVIGLALTNGLAGGAGFIIAQYQGFSDVSMGTGLVIMSLASLVIGESMIRPTRTVLLLVAPIFGMLVYQAIVALALSFGLHPADLKLITAVLALLFVVSERFTLRQNVASRKVGNHNV